MTKDIIGKTKLRLLPYKALKAAAEIREYGIKKYKGDNYAQVPSIEFVDATLRHVYKYLDGQEIDDESGHHHLHHALCSILLAVAVLENDRDEEGRALAAFADSIDTGDSYTYDASTKSYSSADGKHVAVTHDEAWKERFDERVGIVQNEGGLTQDEAEELVLFNIRAGFKI
jgi:hypothetical protein